MTRRRLMVHVAMTLSVSVACVVVLIGTVLAADVQGDSSRVMTPRAFTTATRVDIQPDVLAVTLAPPRLAAEKTITLAAPGFRLSALLREGSAITGVLVTSAELGSSPVLKVGDVFGQWRLVEASGALLTWRRDDRTFTMDVEGNWRPAEGVP